jgi:hypothetical protein
MRSRPRRINISAAEGNKCIHRDFIFSTGGLTSHTRSFRDGRQSPTSALRRPDLPSSALLSSVRPIVWGHGTPCKALKAGKGYQELHPAIMAGRLKSSVPPPLLGMPPEKLKPLRG